MNATNKLNVMRVLVVGAALLFGVCANADVIKSVVYNNVQFLTSQIIDTPVKLTTAGATSVTFSAAVSGKYTIMYSASCEVVAVDQIAYLHVTILVDGTAIAITNNVGDPFCAMNRGYHTILVPTGSLSVGTHTVQIRATEPTGTLDAYLGPSSLIILK